MDRKYFNELSRILAKKGIKSTVQRDDNLTILLDDLPACHVGATSQMFVTPGDLRTTEADDLYHRTASIAEMVKEYLTAIEKAPLLKARDLDEDFRLLADFNGIVLAGRETEKGYGYKYVTWQRDYDGTGVGQGHYYIDNYLAAKEDFAKRAGFVPRDRLFTNEQLTEIYRSLRNTLDSELKLTYEQEKLIEKTASQIECAVPDIQDRVGQAKGMAQELSI
ncbi:MAG: hypothetical protein EOM54_14715 [Clostridia bacterium]|nr:hypothetical protein [Clostridia bacterium]